MSDSWDDYADDWDANENARTYADCAFASLIMHLGIQGPEWQQRRILDFGCGTGLLTEKLGPLVEQVIAVDTSQKMIDRLVEKQLANVVPVCVNFDDDHDRELASGLTGFDLIVASSVCSFLPDYEATLVLLAKSLNAGGHFVQWDWLQATGEGDGLSVNRVVDAIGKAGLNCVHAGEAFTLATGQGEAPVLIGVAANVDKN